MHIMHALEGAPRGLDNLQDMNVLHSQERKLMRKSKGWRDYYCATQSDAGVTAFWRWLTTYAGAVPFKA
jgi:hypothetical protein